MTHRGTTLKEVMLSSRNSCSSPGVPAGADALLLSRLDGVFDVRRQQWVTMAVTDQPHQKVAARSMVEGLPTGSLIIADLGYFGVRWFDDPTDAGQLWLSRHRATVSSEVIHTFYAEGETLDALIPKEVMTGTRRVDRVSRASC